MVRRKKGILRREKIFVDGMEIEVDTYDAKVTLGSGTELESIDELLKQEETEKAIQAALNEIDIIAKRYSEKDRDIWYYYEAGKILQFVDNPNFTDRRRGLIWHRMAYDLKPHLFGGIKKNPQEAKRYPETMYYLGKQFKKNVARASLDQWYEILKFKDIYKDSDLINQILGFCEQGLSGIQLRHRIKELRASKSKDLVIDDEDHSST